MELIKLLVAIMIVLLQVVWGCSGCLESERIALLQLKASINYPNGSSLTSWGANDIADCCEWEGVACNSTTGRVTELALHSIRHENLGDWYINTSLFLPFERLNYLDLGDNQIADCVENEGFEKLSKLVDLENFILNWNKLNNSILSSLNAISSLKLLWLSHNELNGIIYIQEFSNLTSLEELNMRWNKIEGFEGGEELQRLNNLEILYLSHNQFDNNSLSSIKGFSSLKSLNISYNQLKGSLDITELDALINLQDLDLSGNKIDEFMSSRDNIGLRSLNNLYLDNITINNNKFALESLRLFPNLKTLNARDNNFEGSIISEELHTLSNLEGLILDGSDLDGSYLHHFGAMRSLKVLSLSRCGLNNTLSYQGLCELKNLEELSFNGNHLEGVLPSCLGNMSHLRFMDISNNKFNGNMISSPITKLTSLEVLILSNNNFQIPNSFNSFANLSKLKVLFIDGNRLIAETGFHVWTPKFQLRVFIMSRCSLQTKTPPKFLYHQYDLRIVDVSSNNIGGLFPSWLLENNTRLETILLRDNSFSSAFELPSHANTNLSWLDISNNNLHGRIPQNISETFPYLWALIASENSFQGSIPPSVTQSVLAYLDLSNNRLSGKVPEQLLIGRFSVVSLNVSHNNLSGKFLPTKNFSGKVSETLSKSYIGELDISNNQLFGELPWLLGKMARLRTIILSKNHFSGPIPMELCNLEDLQFLDLSHNNLSGSIPSCLNPPKMLQAHLNGNQLSGLLGRAFYNCINMVTLDLSHNNFTGTIPDWIDTVSSLSILLLKGNHFSGEIPPRICHLMQLNILDLSENHLSGIIPPCLSNLTFKATEEKFAPFNPYFFRKCDQLLNYVGNTTLDWNFDLSEYINIREQVEFTTKKRSDIYEGLVLKYMSGIDFSCNQLTGKIPPDIGSLSEIHALNLSHNNLTSSIPATFSKLKQIESLDLSHNRLSGRIPPQLVELTAMGTFSVANNNLSGSIPDMKFQFGTFNESSYEGNPFLCGPPLPNRCSGDKSPSANTPSDTEGEDSGFIDKDAFYASFVASYAVVLLGIAAILYINPHWRRAWFYHLEVMITTCRYFVEDNFNKLF